MARLSQHDLSNLTFRGKNLTSIVLRESNLEGADLRDTRLWDADLRGSKLSGASLAKSDLTHAHLERTDLTNVDVKAVQLANTYLRGASLPKHLEEFKQLDEIESITGTTEKLWLILLIACGYAILSIFSTSDVTLLPNAPSKVFHGLSVPVPTATLYVCGPILMLGVAAAFYRYLHYLWTAVAQLPEEFPDGRHKRVAIEPWVVSREVVAFYRSDRGYRNLTWQWSWLIPFFVWWMPPTVIILSWARYLVRHDWTGTIVQIVVAATAVILSIHAQRQTAFLLQPNSDEIVKDKMARKYAVFALIVAMALLSYGAIEGLPEDWNVPPAFKLVASGTNCVTEEIQSDGAKWSPGVDFANPRIWAPRILSITGWSAFADVSNQFVGSEEVEEGQSESKTSVPTRGADLQGRQMRFLRAVRSSFYSANLQRVDLRGANLMGADFRTADLTNAKLNHAFVKEANFRDAILEAADFNGAILDYAHFENAVFLRTKMTNATLQGTTFQGEIVGVFMAGANLQGADFSGVTLSDVQLDGASLSACNLTNTTFQNCSIRCANVDGAKFWGTKFIRCDLFNVNLPNIDTNHVTVLFPR